VKNPITRAQPKRDIKKRGKRVLSLAAEAEVSAAWANTTPSENHLTAYLCAYGRNPKAF
jgi:hypothetical protein